MHDGRPGLGRLLPCRAAPAPPRRILAFGKWTGLGLCISIAGVWLASGWCALNWMRISTRWGHCNFMVGVGRVYADHWGGHAVAVGTPRYGSGQRLALGGGSSRWSWTLDWYFGSIPGMAGRLDAIAIPLWAPFLLTAAPTAFLWWHSRRPLPGHCPCGYSLAGNTSGVCPECGQGGP